MKKFSKKIYFWGLIAFAMVAIFSTAISTMAWFTLVSPPASSMVTGGADVNIESVTGYKVPEVRNSNGFIDYANDKVFNKEIKGTDFKPTENAHQEGEDLNFDVPAEGIGYYLLTPNDKGIFKFMADKSNYKKFTAYDYGDLLSLTMDLTPSTPFRIRSYQMKDHKTDLQTIDLVDVGGPATLDEESHEVTVTSNGNYKVWYDKVQQKVGVERLGDIENLLGRPMPKHLSQQGGSTVWLNIDKIGWWDENAKLVLDVYDANENHVWTQMTQDNGSKYYRAVIPSGNWANMSFYRLNSSWTSGVDWDARWNRQENVNFPTGTNNCYKLSDWNNNGSWETYKYAEIKVGSSGSFVDMNYDNGEWKYTIDSEVADGTTLSFKKNGSAISVTASADGTGLNVNNFDGSKITAGGSGITVYLHEDNTVWADPINVYYAKYSSKFHAMTFDPGGNFGSGHWKVDAEIANDAKALEIYYSKIKKISVSASSDTNNAWYNKNNFDGSKVKAGGSTTIYFHPNDNTVWVDSVVEIRSGEGAWSQMTVNPKNTDELCATGMTVSEGDTVAIKVNGADFTDFTAKDANLNNINSDKQIIKSASNVGMYLSKSNKDLWVDGNKIYNLKVGGVDKGEMVYQSSGDFPGWYGMTGVAIEDNDTIAVSLTTKEDSDELELVADTAHSNNNFNASTLKALRGGTVDVYLNTSGNALYITPVYWAQVGASDVNATLVGDEYRAEFSAAFSGDSAVKVYVNATELSDYTADGDRSGVHNNCYGTAGNLKVIFDTEDNGIVVFNTTNKKVYVDGYAPCYFVKVGNGSWLPMTDMGDDCQVKLAITASADTVLKFRKNAAGSEITATAKASAYLNNYANGKIIDAIEEKTVYFNYTNNELWVPGRHLAYHFYTEDAEEGTPHAYLWENGHVTEQEHHYNAVYPGVEMTDESATIAQGVYSIDYVIHDDFVVNRLIFNLGQDQKQSVDIDISAIDGIGKYFYLKNETDTQGHYKYAYYANPPSTSEDYIFYVHDPGTAGSQKFGSDVCVYAWDSQGQTMPVATYPGKAMTAIVPGSLWVCKISNAYEGMVFASSDGNNETSDINNISQHDGGLFVATTNTSGTVSGAWATEKSSATINAKIYINNSAQGIDMAIGDNAGSNKYIYEAGLQAKHGDTLKVVADGVTFSTSSNFVDDKIDRPYLDVTESSITVKLGSSSETARFNFYVTDEETPKLSIVMVPDLGNGFYIMPYQNSTEGFVAGKKMSSITSTSATYAGFYAKKDDRVFLRSYVDAVDKGYELDGSVDDSIATCDDSNKMIITFQKTAYFTIEISNNTVKIKEFTINEFLNLNPLDKTNASSQPAIKAMHTAMVFEVKYHVSDCAFAMTPILSVTNDQPNYIGVAASFTASPQTNPNPYAYMTDSARYNYDSKTNVNGLTIRGSSFDLGDATFKTDLNNSTKSYYVYFLIDYVYSNNLASMPYGLNGRLSFHLKVNQA